MTTHCKNSGQRYINATIKYPDIPGISSCPILNSLAQFPTDSQYTIDSTSFSLSKILPNDSITQLEHLSLHFTSKLNDSITQSDHVTLIIQPHYYETLNTTEYKFFIINKKNNDEIITYDNYIRVIGKKLNDSNSINDSQIKILNKYLNETITFTENIEFNYPLTLEDNGLLFQENGFLILL